MEGLTCPQEWFNIGCLPEILHARTVHPHFSQSVCCQLGFNLEYRSLQFVMDAETANMRIKRIVWCGGAENQREAGMAST